MKIRSEQGAISAAAIIAVTMTLLFVASSSFAFWAFGGMQDYKNNTNEKIDAAVEVAKKQAETAKDNQFAEASKSPVKAFQGSSTYGNVNFEYPKTYSAYVVEKNSDSSPIDGYFHPNIVPSVTADGVSFAIRFRVVGESYSSVLKGYDTYVKSGKAKVSAFRAAKVPQALGSRIDGQLTAQKKGSMVLLPLRDKTIEIWTESADYTADFNTYVIPSISFVP